MGNIWFVWPIDCNVKHHILQRIIFLYMPTLNVQTHLKSTVSQIHSAIYCIYPN